MTYRESLRLFNLNENYTIEELKKTYRNLMRKYHPDLYMNSSEKERTAVEEKCKKINEAYLELLKKFDYSNTYTNTYNNRNNYQNNQTEEIKRHINKLNKIVEIIVEEIQEIREKYNCIEIALKNFKNYIDKIKRITSYDEIIRYKEIINYSYEYLKQKLVNEFYEKNNIKEGFLIYMLNYDLSLKDFYKTLEEIKKANDKKLQIEKVIRTSIEQLDRVSPIKIGKNIKTIDGLVDILLGGIMETTSYTKVMMDDMMEEIIRENGVLYRNYISKNELYQKTRKLVNNFKRSVRDKLK